MKERYYDTLKAQSDLDDKHIRQVITEAEKIAGVRCFMPWQTFVIEVMKGHDLTSPPEPEEPQWWYWDSEQQWRLSFERTPRVEIQDGKVVSAVVFGTTDDRELKVDRLRDTFCAFADAKREADKP